MTKSRTGPGSADTYHFLLFVAGDEPNSRLAKANLKAFCDANLPGRARIEIIDVIKDFKAALDHNVVVTPTLIAVKPEPKVTIYGNLSNFEKIRIALRLDAGISPSAPDISTSKIRWEDN